MEKLKEWFENPDYQVGCRLYLQLIGKDYNYELFQVGENSFTSDKLYKCLYEYFENLPVDRKEDPKEIVDQKALAQKLMNERAELKSFLRAQYLQKVDDRETRTAAALRIQQIRPELNRIFGNIQLFNDQGIVVLETSNEEPGDDSMQRYLNLRSYITRYTSCLEKNKTLHGNDMTAEQKVTYQQKLLSFIAEKSELESQLNNAVLLE